MRSVRTVAAAAAGDSFVGQLHLCAHFRCLCSVHMLVNQTAENQLRRPLHQRYRIQTFSANGHKEFLKILGVHTTVNIKIVPQS